MIVALIALTGLVTLGSLTVMSIQGGITAVGQDRSKSVALYIAESGAAAGADYLRKNIQNVTFFSDLVEPNNVNPQKPTGIAGNGARPGQSGNMFSLDQNAWYEVEILNNVEDGGLAAGDDTDKAVVIRSTGHGPGGATAQVEWYIAADAITGLGRPCPSYGQKGMSEDGAGRNDCLTTVVSTDVATYSPGTP
ncbi:MAG: hypothetical protein IPL61_33600 [Myxococcales bacterium]|nr:hypothetical protein [Myxococcales bacterium]